MSKVYVALPNEGWIRRELLVACIEMLNNNCGHRLHLDVRHESPIDHNRNQMVKSFLESDYEYMLFIDSDNPPTRNPLELVAKDYDIIGCPTPITYGKRRDWEIGKPNTYYNAVDWSETKGAWVEHTETEGLQEVGAVGTGCMLIARRVLEEVRPAFIREWDPETGLVVKGSDYWFCYRAREKGFRVFCDYTRPCCHFKEQDLLAWKYWGEARDIAHADRPNINTKEYWDGQWQGREERILPVYEPIKNLCNGDRILDYGCGRGDLLAMLGENAEGVDLSQTAVDICRSRGLKARQGDDLPEGEWDTIVCTEVLEHVDNDRELLEKFFQKARRVIYSVPNNCLPPGVEAEHRRVYTDQRVKEITPHFKWAKPYGDYALVYAEKEVSDGSS